MSMSLYEINEAIQRCFVEPTTEEVVDTETGEIFDADYLDALEMAREEKIENIALFIKNLDAEADAIKAEKMKLAKRQQMTENKAESLRKYLSMNMSGEKFNSARVSIGWRKSEKVEIAEGAEIPEYLCKIETKPMLTEIKKAIKNGESIKGCQLIESQNIQIK